MHESPGRDRRVRRTERQLRAALASLIREKPYDAIAVKEILDRADVARSTFYTHFADKDELLVSGIHDVLRSGEADATSGTPGERLVWFSRPVLEHIAEHRLAGEARMGRRGRAVLHRHLRRTLREAVSDRLHREPGAAGRHGATAPELVVEFIVSNFALVLDWWVESGSALTAVQADQLFRSLVLPALGGPLAGA